MFLLAIVSKLYYIIGTKSSFHVHSMLKKFQQDLKEPCFGLRNKPTDTRTELIYRILVLSHNLFYFLPHQFFQRLKYLLWFDKQI